MISILYSIIFIIGAYALYRLFAPECCKKCGWKLTVVEGWDRLYCNRCGSWDGAFDPEKNTNLPIKKPVAKQKGDKWL